MRKILLGLGVIVLVASCEKENSNPHMIGTNCGGCHNTEFSQWSSSNDLHALSAKDVLTNVEHNTSELLTDDCLKCHSTFQYLSGVAHFVSPVDQTGSPAGTWTILNSGDWKATNCEVCHNPSSNNTMKLAKFGSILDGPWNAGYTSVSDLPAAYQKLINLANGDTSTYIYPDQTSLSVQATKLCSSCHDPADEGGDPEVVAGKINYGSQGGDSRAYVATGHKGFGCIDCHNPHDFTVIDPKTIVACNICHVDSKTGKVHLNHL